jgi:two-component system alkaline phosphatase synthesis response regulator PhoP
MAMDSRLKAGNIVMDRERYAVVVGDERVELTYIEFELLATLIRERGRVLSPAQLLETVWGTDESDGSSRKLAVHVSRLRKKIAKSEPYRIRTVARRGYSLSEMNERGPRPAAFGEEALSAAPLKQGLSEGS